MHEMMQLLGRASHAKAVLDAQNMSLWPQMLTLKEIE